MADWKAALDRAAGPGRAMVFYGRQMLGAPQDHEAPPVTALVTPTVVLAALERIDRARQRLESLWFDLSGEEKERLPSPEQLSEQLREALAEGGGD
jgi:hypothetical protein